MRTAVTATLLLLIAAAPVPARVRHEGAFAAGAPGDRFVIRQLGAEAFELEIFAGKVRCTYPVGWIRIRPQGLVRTVDFQGTLSGRCAISPAPSVDGALVLDRPGAGGVIRLIGASGVATEFAVDRVWEP